VGELLFALVLYAVFALMSIVGGYLIVRRHWTRGASLAFAAAILLFYLALLWGMWWLVESAKA
jgi:hypothetical protein